MKQIVLSARGCSGRGVRLELLTPPQRAAIRDEAAKAVGPTATMSAWRDRETRDAVAAMVLQVTERDGFKVKDELFAKDVSWKPVSADTLVDHPEKYFNPKDLDALGKIFRRLHDVTDEELDAILGEAQDVTAD